MYWYSITYFFVVTITTGTLIDLLVKEWRADWLEKMVLRFGVGLATMSVVGVILNLVNIPLDYRILLAVGVFILLGALVRKRKSSTANSPGSFPATTQYWKNRSFWYGIVMLVLCAVTVKMYVGGAFNYTYFEDTDPWGYAAVADFIGENKTFSVPYYSVQYSEPYTQGYQIVMGVISQTNDSIYWTMKFFHSLICSFGVLFIYYFARRFSKNEELALLAGIFLFSVPAWVSHFVFSLHFNMTIFVVLLYVLAQMMPERVHAHSSNTAQEERTNIYEPEYVRRTSRTGWMWVGIVVYASMLINHFSSVFHASIFCFVFIVTGILAERKIDWKTPMVFVGGFTFSLLFYVPAFARHWWLIDAAVELGGVNSLLKLIRSSLTVVIVSFLILISVLYLVRRWQPQIEKWLAKGSRGLVLWLSGLAFVLVVLFLPVELSHTLGTGDQVYKWDHFFNASSINMMNNPFGLGSVLMSSVLVSLLFASVKLKKLFTPENAWVVISYGWVITAFLLVLGKYLSIAIAPFRAWTFLGFFVSFFAAWGIVAIIKCFTDNHWVTLGMIVLLTSLLIPTTFIPKYRINTMIWQDHTIGVPESHELFEWMRDGGVPKNSVVAHLCGNSEFLSGYDMNPPIWNETFHPKRGLEEPYFVTHPLNLTDEAIKVLKKAEVEYVTLGASCLWQDPVPADREEAYGFLLRRKMDEYMADSRLTLIKNTGLEVLFKLK